MLNAIDPDFFVASNDKIFFSAYSYEAGIELWVTDGTVSGTKMVKDLTPGVASTPIYLDNSITFGNKLVFTATDSVNIDHLWSTDGTAEGTVELKGSNFGDSISYISLLPAYNIYYNYNNYNSYNYSDINFSNIHTPPYHGKAFVSIYSAERQSPQLWITNGTAAGTVLVKDGNTAYSDGHDYFYTANGLFFSTSSDRGSKRLWRSDGTSTGTGLVGAFDTIAVAYMITSRLPFFNFVYNNQLYMTYGSYHYDPRDLFVVDENVTLPISLYNFAATGLPSKAVKLEWNSTNEINSSHFDVERSADGINFNDIGKVNAAGNAASTHRYEYTDGQPVHLRNPVLFYRLKMVDKDASFKYSRVLAIHFDESSFEFTFSPNPVRNQLSVVVASPGSKTIALRVIDASGKQVYQQKLSSAQTINQQKY